MTMPTIMEERLEQLHVLEMTEAESPKNTSRITKKYKVNGRSSNYNFFAALWKNNW